MPNLRIEYPSDPKVRPDNPALVNPVPGHRLYVDANNTARTLVVAEFCGSEYHNIIMSFGLAGAGTLTTPTHAAIAAALPRPELAQSWFVRIHNGSDAAQTWTLGAGSGVTLIGSGAIAQATWKEYRCDYTPGVSGATIMTLITSGVNV